MRGYFLLALLALCVVGLFFDAIAALFHGPWWQSAAAVIFIMATGSLVWDWRRERRH